MMDLISDTEHPILKSFLALSLISYIQPFEGMEIKEHRAYWRDLVLIAL